jgi:hypothetical protein
VDFFPVPPSPIDEEYEQPPQPVWSNAPDDVVPGVVPLELILGRSESAVIVRTCGTTPFRTVGGPTRPSRSSLPTCRPCQNPRSESVSRTSDSRVSFNKRTTISRAAMTLTR